MPDQSLNNLNITKATLSALTRYKFIHGFAYEEVPVSLQNVLIFTTHKLKGEQVIITLKQQLLTNAPRCSSALTFAPMMEVLSDASRDKGHNGLKSLAFRTILSFIISRIATELTASPMMM